MDASEHFEYLIRMHDSVKINEFYQPTLAVGEGTAEIEINLSEAFHHAAGGVHGSVYFKMLDDAAWYAANSLEQEYFLVTVSFTTYITRPVSSGKMRAVGRVVNKNTSQFISEAVVYDADGREIGRGNGVFVRSKALLANAQGYTLKTAQTNPK
ncbi:PaaI family thioesterase [Paraglaciecola psychrophila]|uniref:Thioesterase domain-containing protein n=1 Tax=Paraglaciecola psychrophila 170 TaxID=1129794 RepID=K7ABY1_9ALTE|nr:PaaI family thioesterase [Paraglaciecola psychrophila]AGH45537.1 hypothetical protein C427_3428 [Paraglaciecola psychrophila 170]GAC38198.1 hypothetical protein GPSY_2584 [Paraglaciecola psychrophila 170]